MEVSHVTSVTRVQHVGFEVQIQIYGLGEVVEKKPLVGASIRRLSLWNIQARTKQATGVALRGTLLRPVEKASFDIHGDTHAVVVCVAAGGVALGYSDQDLD